jgi:hypothetical protein
MGEVKGQFNADNQELNFDWMMVIYDKEYNEIKKIRK